MLVKHPCWPASHRPEELGSLTSMPWQFFMLWILSLPLCFLLLNPAFLSLSYILALLGFLCFAQHLKIKWVQRSSAAVGGRMTAAPLVFPQGVILLHQERKIELPPSPAPCTILVISTWQCLSAGSPNMNGAFIEFHANTQTRSDIPVTLLAPERSRSHHLQLSMKKRLGSLLKVSRKEDQVSGFREKLPFEFSFLPPVKTIETRKWSSLKKKKKDSQANFSHSKGRTLLLFPASSAFSKGDLCCKKQLLEVISGEDPLFFASLISPFVLSGSSDESHGTCRKAILNPRFSCQMYRRLKPDKGGHCHSPCCSRAGLDDSWPLAVPGAKALSFSFQLHIPYLWRGKWGSQICPSLLVPPAFCWRPS